ncbi:MAG: hypothetical protein DWQ01_04800 [Planctomycetota bacterium]|nr:MAG: hypothetical protein DWQ01_04800 [Planctomycetota bacterium]
MDGKRMNVPITGSSGQSNADTVFHFHQEGSTVTAHYAGGTVVHGYLVGLLHGDQLEFRYAQLDTNGKLYGGHSVCELEMTSSGRIRMYEHFEWDSQEGSGTNVFEELPAESADEA